MTALSDLRERLGRKPDGHAGAQALWNLARDAIEALAASEADHAQLARLLDAAVKDYHEAESRVKQLEELTDRQGREAVDAIAAVQKDAERYRWLKENCSYGYGECYAEDGAAHYDTAEQNYNYLCGDVTHYADPPASAGQPQPTVEHEPSE